VSENRNRIADVGERVAHMENQMAAKVSDKITSLENKIQNKLVDTEVKLLTEAAAVRAKMDSNLKQTRSRCPCNPQIIMAKIAIRRRELI
jgi:hypothetical protein